MLFRFKLPWLSATVVLSLFSEHKAQLPQVAIDAAISPSPSNAYSTWLKEHGHNYDHQAFFGKDEEVVAHWKIHSNTLFLAAAVEAKGWLGFGIASAGGMPGSDIVSFTSKSNELRDSYALVDGMPLTDICQDWTLHNSVVESNFILFEASRPLRTGDTQDHDIVDDSDLSQPSHRVIAAWGDSDEVSFHFGNRTKGFVRFFSGGMSENESQVEGKITNNSTAEAATMDTNVGTIELKTNNFPIPEVETTYQSFCFSYQDLQDQGLPGNSTVHMISADFVGDPNTQGLVHHMNVYATENDGAPCEEAYKMIYIWAPGAEPFHLPYEAGFALGKDGFKKLRMEIHYDNRDGAMDKIDNSGVKISFTSKLRKHEAGVFTMGDVTGSLFGQDVGRGYTQYDFICPESCTHNHFRENVTVFLEMLHMHETGARMVNTHYRGEKVVHEGYIDYYDFEAAGAFTMVQKQFEIVPGDAIHTTCFYEEQGMRKFGPGSRDEMCVGFLLYYPKVEDFYDFCGVGAINFTLDPSCDGSFTKRTLASETEIGRSFGVGSTQCAHNVSYMISSRIWINSASVWKTVVWANSVAIIGILVGMLA